MPLTPTAASPPSADREGLVQLLIGIGRYGGDPAAAIAQHGPLVQHGLAAGIGVDDLPVRVDEKHAGADAVEGIGECRGLGGLELDRPGDQHRAANMRHDLPHAPVHVVVDETLPLLPKNPEQCGAGGGFVEHRGPEVYQALRPSPFLTEARPLKLVRRHDVGRGDRPPDFGQDLAAR